MRIFLKELKFPSTSQTYIWDITKKINDAIDRLSTINKEAVNDVILLLKSASAIAKQKGINVDDLSVKMIKADQGPAMKRRWKRAKGSSTAIRKEFSHITLSVSMDGGKE